MRFLRERSAGGLAFRTGPEGPELLMIRVRNLEGRVLWTFPKGHLDGDETDVEAALREVEEETGWRCGVLGARRAFSTVRYRFLRKGRPVKKSVAWFLMEPLRKTGGRDPDEVMKVRWTGLKAAERVSAYPSDKKLLKKLRKYFSRRAGSSRRPRRSSDPRSSATPRSRGS